MKGNEITLNGLIEEVLAQMREQNYGKKIYSHYQYSFSLLKSVAADLGIDALSEPLVKAFLDSPVNCRERWGKKERIHRKRCIRMLLSLAENGMIDWGRQKSESICQLLHVRAFRMELEKFLKQMEEDGLSRNTIVGYRRIVTYFLIFCQENNYESLSDLKSNDISRFITSLYRDGKYRPTTIGSALSGFRRFLSSNAYTKRFLLEIPAHLPREGYGSEAIQPLLKLFERHPTTYFGDPGEIVDFIERFRGEYENSLAASVKRNPTITTVWKLNRCINAGEHTEIFMDCLKEIAKRTDIHKDIQARAQEYLGFQTNR